jgi:phage terminase large subunit-like protein
MSSSDRTHSLVLEELVGRKTGAEALLRLRESIQDKSFPEQNAFVLDEGRFLSALCTRRAGKSNGLSLRFFRTLIKYSGCFCPYIALTRESARNIMWEILQEHDERFKIGAKFTESNLTVTLPNDSRLQLFGADMKNFARRLKGIKTPGAAIDEAQDFGSHIEYIVETVLEPATSDYSDGWLAVTGTPGPVPHGYFYDVTEKGRGKPAAHRWSVYQNPYMPGIREHVQNLKAKKAWQDDNPTLRREWFGEWVLDLKALVIQYEAERNHYDNLPVFRAGSYVIGVDIGFDDSDAISVLGWDKKAPHVYLVEERVSPQQGITELARQISELVDRYQPLRIVMDTGGLGKKIAEEIRRRFAIPVVAAEKTRKFEFIELLNDALRTRTFFAKRDSQFAQDAARLKWDQDALELKIADTFHSDVIDSTLYAFREALHWLYEPEVIKPVVGSAAWRKQQADEMERDAEAQVMAQLEAESDPWASYQ